MSSSSNSSFNSSSESNSVEVPGVQAPNAVEVPAIQAPSVPPALQFVQLVNEFWKIASHVLPDILSLPLPDVLPDGPPKKRGKKKAYIHSNREPGGERRLYRDYFDPNQRDGGIVATRESAQSGDDASLDEKVVRRERRREKKRKRLLKEAEKAEEHGVCYLSRVPPHMNPLRLRQILSQYGEIGRVYLTPEDPANQMHRKKSAGFRGQDFSEGWVEFIDKKIAKRVASMLNGEQIGGKKRSSIYYDLWNIKYLSKFKWDDLKEETEIKNATREQNLVLELSAAIKERDFYLSKVDQSKAISKIGERLKKKREIEMVPKVVRHFPQKRPVGNEAGESKGQLSRDILA